MEFLSCNKWSISKLVCLVVFTTLCSISAPYLLAQLIDKLSNGFSAWPLFLGFLLYSSLFGIAVAFRRGQGYVAQSLESNLNFVLSVNFIKKVSLKTPNFFVKCNPAEIQAASQLAQSALRTIFNLVFLVVFPGIIQFVLSLLLVGSTLNLAVAVIVMIYGIVFISITYIASVLTRPLLGKANQAFQENAKQAGNMITAMETIRYYGGQNWAVDRFNIKAEEIRDSWKDWASKHTRYSMVLGIALTLQFSANFYIILPEFDKNNISVGDVVLFNVLIMQLNVPFDLLGTSISRFFESYSKLEPANQIWAAAEEPTEDSVLEVKCNNSADIISGRLQFKNVSFSYVSEDRKNIALRNVNFLAERGKITFITGKSGAGKSTLLKLALKTAEPDNGSIFIDGVNLRFIQRKELYSLIGVVSQEVILLSDSIRDNITLGRAATNQEIEMAISRAAISDFIQTLPEGLSTLVGERGLRLSGGERQRIAIARALLKKPQILYLDEASSALDENTEKAIMDKLRELSGEMTIIAITHRKGVINATDKLVELEGGKIN
ncbi:ABC transporter ATP-binding protein [Lentilitoribacter sp. EG35]|uniref:ABC transporter ATP-binding protein n=1 Tax=Lentilitoribacter sp. EG35 TaxID=3234192 RepID=UPI003460E916